MKWFDWARKFLSEEFVAPEKSERPSLVALVLICASIFIAALGVRLLHWQDSQIELDSVTGLVRDYRREAKRIADDGGILFPSKPVDTTDARMLLHPPGYSILMLAVYGNEVDRKSFTALHLIQIICDSAMAVLVFIIAAELLPVAAGVIAGLMVAFSPHLSHYSFWLTPDSLAVAPILIAVYMIVRARKRPRLVMIIGAGVLIGVSCWLRSNALLLVVFVAAAIWLMFDREKRLRYSVVMIGATVITMMPITVRNYVVYGKFIPLSLGAGITLVEGIADYDDEKRFGMSADDHEAGVQEAERAGRPEYLESLWNPDGIERDRTRFADGLRIIRSNPAWFAGVMIRRAAFMLSYDRPPKDRWPFYSVLVPLISAGPPFGHTGPLDEQAQPSWAASPVDFIGGGEILAREAEIKLAPDQQSVRVTGDASEFGDQFASTVIAVEPGTDYLIVLSLNSTGGPAAVKATSADRRIAMASTIVTDSTKMVRKSKRKNREDQGDESNSSESEMGELHIAFATGNRTEARIVVSNNGGGATRPTLELRQARLYRLGATPHRWTAFVRPAMRWVQRNLYTTARMLPLVLIGALLLAIAGRRRALIMLLAVPIYYLVLQSAFHTEYRYALAIHYFLFILAAATLYFAGRCVAQGAHKAVAAFRRRQAQTPL